MERAKASLLSAVPGRRGPGAPLAVALAGFEEGLREATAAMPSWRETVVQSAWRACASALEEASRRAEHLRLEATPQGYEELYVALGELLDPLEAFRSAAEARRNMGRDR